MSVECTSEGLHNNQMWNIKHWKIKLSFKIQWGNISNKSSSSWETNEDHNQDNIWQETEPISLEVVIIGSTVGGLPVLLFICIVCQHNDEESETKREKNIM